VIVSVKFQDYYQTLGVARDVDHKEIRKAYRKLAKQYHPDRNQTKEAEAKFKEIGEAYEVLGDKEKRQRYDLLGENYHAGQDFRPPPGWENMQFNFGGGGGGGGGGMSDFFESLFGGQGGQQRGGFSGMGGFGRGQQGFRRPRPRKGKDREAELQVTLFEAYNSSTRSITLKLSDGSTKTYQVKIPVGVVDGTKIRLAGEGNSGVNGGPVGDLLLKIKLCKDPRFELQGQNLRAELQISPWEAALGAKVPFTTLDGEVKLGIPSGSQSGQKLRLKGKGMPRKRGGRGDLFAVLKIVVPKELSDTERELFERLREESDFQPRGG
jgi:curved DNA-binding protein